MRHTRTTPPTVLPVGLDEVKRRLDNYTGTDLDESISEQIRVASEYLEDYLWRSFITTTWTLVVDGGFPAVIPLPRPPFISLTSLSYVDQDGDSQTLTSNDYRIRYRHDIALLAAPYNGVWPVTRYDADVVTVVYTAGYGTTRTSVPLGIRNAVAILAAHYVRSQWAGCYGDDAIPGAVKDLVAPYKVYDGAVLQCL